MKKSLSMLTVVLFAAMCLCAAAVAADTAAMMKQADDAWAQRADKAKTQEAADLYEAILVEEPTNYDAAWKAAKALYRVGDKGPDDAKEATFEKAVNLAKKAVQIKPDDPMGHYWLGVVYGQYGKAKGISKSLSLVDPIKEEMAFVISKDPKFEGGGAQRVLGRLYFKLPGLFGGDNDKSIEYLEEAVKIGPNYYLNHVFLAETLADEGEDERAEKLLNQVINANDPPAGLEPEMADWKAEAKRVLEDM